jgi:hypothetical protein
MKCQHPVVVSYTPKKGVNPNDEVEAEIHETSSDVKTCDSEATYVWKGVRYCDHHYSQITKIQGPEEYEIEEPVPFS